MPRKLVDIVGVVRKSLFRVKEVLVVSIHEKKHGVIVLMAWLADDLYFFPEYLARQLSLV